jgi:hypothetical protein
MKKQIQNAITYFCMAVAVLMAAFFFVRSTKLQDRVDAMQTSLHPNRDSVERAFFHRISAIDSMLLGGNYAAAHAAYEQLPEEFSRYDELANVIQLRALNLDKLERMQGRLRLFEGKEAYHELSEKLMEKRHEIDSLTRQLSLSAQQHVAQLDSLNFALEKADMRTEVLKSQLTNNSDLGYLTFVNKKGVEVHYVGEVADGQASGWGVGISDAGLRYEGEWKDNLYHGEGVLHWPDHEYYKGSFQLGDRHGHGNYYWPDGEMFSGEWDQDQRNGKGVFYGKDGKIMAKGTWKSNELLRAKK